MNNTTYKIINNTYYKAVTPDKVITILERCRKYQTRIIIEYGDVKTGIPWAEPKSIGRIGRSTGNIKIPLLVYNKRSLGGGGILTQCIVKITESKGKRIIYKVKV